MPTDIFTSDPAAGPNKRLADAATDPLKLQPRP